MILIKPVSELMCKKLTMYLTHLGTEQTIDELIVSRQTEGLVSMAGDQVNVK